MERLPSDVLIDVVSVGSIDTKSLLRLSWTSKSMHASVLSNRSIWLITARRLLCDELIPEVAVNLEALDAAQLVQYATRKERILLGASSGTPPSFSRADFQLLPPSRTRPPISEEELPADHILQNMELPRPILVSGGRWIIGICGNDDLWTLACWDLQAGSGDGGLTPVASAIVGSLRLYNPFRPSILDWNWHDDEKSLVVLVRNEFELEVFQWKHGGSSAFIKSAAVSKGQISCQLGGDHVIIQQQFPELWNWRTGSIALSPPFDGVPIEVLHYQCLTASGTPFDVSVAVHPTALTFHFSPLFLACRCERRHSDLSSCPEPEISADKQDIHEIYHPFDLHYRVGFAIMWYPPVLISSTEVIIHLRAESSTKAHLFFSITNDIRPTLLNPNIEESPTISDKLMRLWGIRSWSDVMPASTMSNARAPSTSTSTSPFGDAPTSGKQISPAGPGHDADTGANDNQSSSSTWWHRVRSYKPRWSFLAPSTDTRPSPGFENNYNFVVSVCPERRGPSRDVAMFARFPEDADYEVQDCAGFCPRSGTWAFRKHPLTGRNGKQTSFVVLSFD